MEVNVKLFGDLREGRFEKQQTELENNSRVIDVIEKYQLPKDEVALCFVNNRNAEYEQVLENGDVVALSPPVGGM